MILCREVQVFSVLALVALRLRYPQTRHTLIDSLGLLYGVTIHIRTRKEQDAWVSATAQIYLLLHLDEDKPVARVAAQIRHILHLEDEETP